MTSKQKEIYQRLVISLCVLLRNKFRSPTRSYLIMVTGRFPVRTDTDSPSLPDFVEPIQNGHYSV